MEHRLCSRLFVWESGRLQALGPNLACLAALGLLCFVPAHPAAPAWKHSLLQEGTSHNLKSVVITQWTQPQPGWLYVLDYPNPNDDEGRVFLVDPQQGKIVGTIAVGAHPEMILSPAGKLLYIASLGATQDTLSVVDTV